MRILVIAEAEQKNRHQVDAYNYEIEIKKIESAAFEAKNNELRIRLDAKNTLIGMIFAFLISCMVISGAVISFWLGHTLFGSILGTGGLAAIVYVFVFGSRQQKK